MGEVAQFVLTGTSDTVEVRLGLFMFSATRVIRNPIQIIKVVINSVVEDRIYIEKVHIDDGVYFTEYPVTASFSSRSTENSSPLYTAETGISSTSTFKELTSYHRISSPHSVIKVGVHYKTHN